MGRQIWIIKLAFLERQVFWIRKKVETHFFPFYLIFSHSLVSFILDQLIRPKKDDVLSWNALHLEKYLGVFTFLKLDCNGRFQENYIPCDEYLKIKTSNFSFYLICSHSLVSFILDQLITPKKDDVLRWNGLHLEKYLGALTFLKLDWNGRF